METPDIIAQQRVRYNRRNVNICLYTPQKVKGGGYICQVEMKGLTSPPYHICGGMDSLQALIHARSSISRVLVQHALYPRDSSGADMSYYFEPVWDETEYLSCRTNRSLLDAWYGERQKLNTFWVNKDKTIRKSSTKVRGKAIASRYFCYRGKRASVVLSQPVREGTSYYCGYQYNGFPVTKRGGVGSCGQTAFQALQLAYQGLWWELTELGTSVAWEYGRSGCHGLPLIIPAEGMKVSNIQAKKQTIMLERLRK